MRASDGPNRSDIPSIPAGFDEHCEWPYLTGEIYR